MRGRVHRGSTPPPAAPKDRPVRRASAGGRAAPRRRGTLSERRGGPEPAAPAHRGPRPDPPGGSPAPPRYRAGAAGWEAALASCLVSDASETKRWVETGSAVVVDLGLDESDTTLRSRALGELGIFPIHVSCVMCKVADLPTTVTPILAVFPRGTPTLIIQYEIT